MPVRRSKRKYKLYKGGNIQQALPAQRPQQVVGQPVQMGMIPQANIPKPQLKTYPKKIRLNVTSDYKSVIEAPEEAEYVLAQRINSQQLYQLDNVYKPTFGKDETTGAPVDLYSEYVYERLKDLKLPSCQELKHRGDRKIEGGVFSSDSTRRQQCSGDIKTLIKDDNRILKGWVANINQYGMKFLENVAAKIEELGEKIKDLQQQKKDKQIELNDATSTLEQNKKGIARETQQRLQEITRIISDKEEDMGGKIDAEINDLQSFIKEETAVTSEIEVADKAIMALDDQIEKTTKQMQKIINGLNKTNAQLQEQGIDLEKFAQEVESSVSQFAMMGGRKKRKYKKKQKGGSINKIIKKVTSKKALSAAVGAATAVALVGGSKKKKYPLKRSKAMSPIESYKVGRISRAYRELQKSEKDVAREMKEHEEMLKKQKLHKKRMGYGGKKSKKSKKSKK